MGMSSRGVCAPKLPVNTSTSSLCQDMAARQTLKLQWKPDSMTILSSQSIYP
jgi:hypothetical protein